MQVFTATEIFKRLLSLTEIPGSGGSFRLSRNFSSFFILQVKKGFLKPSELNCPSLVQRKTHLKTHKPTKAAKNHVQEIAWDSSSWGTQILSPDWVPGARLWGLHTSPHLLFLKKSNPSDCQLQEDALIPFLFFFFLGISMPEKFLARMQLFSKTNSPWFLYAPSLFSFAPACSGSSRSASNTFFPAYVTLYKRRNYQTSSRTAPGECSLHALIRAGSNFSFRFGWEVFFQFKSTCPVEQTIPSFPFFTDTKKKAKERREMGQRKGKTHRETRINKFNQVKGPEEGRRSDLFTQNQNLHPFSQESGPQVGHEWQWHNKKSILLLGVFKTPLKSPSRKFIKCRYFPATPPELLAALGDNKHSTLLSCFSGTELPWGTTGGASGDLGWPRAGWTGGKCTSEFFHKHKNAVVAAWHWALISRSSVIWGIIFLSQLSLCCFSRGEQRSENSWNAFWPQPLICFPQGRSGRLNVQNP